MTGTTPTPSNTTEHAMTTSIDRLLDIAEQLDQLHHQLCDEAEKLIPASSPVKTADNPIALPTVEEVATAIEDSDASAPSPGDRLDPYQRNARAVLDLIASRVPAWVPVRAGTVIKAGTVSRVEGYDWAKEESQDTDWTPYAAACEPMRVFIDPRTVPAEPEDPRVAVVAQALSDTLDDNGVTTCDWTAEARDILARIDAARADR